jgi:hypothetical protein
MAKRKRRHPVMCAYCREVFPECETTADHVPPQGVFGKNRPRNMELVTVPQCRNCKEGNSRGDEILKILLGLGPERPVRSDEVRADVSRAMRFWRPKLAKIIVDQGIEILVDHPKDGYYGIPLGDELADQVHATVKRVAVGLIFKYAPDWDSRGMVCRIRQVLDPDVQRAEAAIRGTYELDWTVNVGAGRFIAKWGFTEEPRCVHLHMTFYGGMAFSVFMFPPHVFPGEEDDLRVAKFKK